jgi:hypothetical protein
VFHFWNRSVFFTFAAVAAVGLSGCSGGGSTPPVAGPQIGNAARGGHVQGPEILRPGMSRMSSQPPVGMQMAWLMTDGTLLAQSGQGNTWYKYTPDSKGGYSDGTWSQVGSLQAGYAPSAEASAVQIDGRLVITGGEYNAGGPYDVQLTNLGAVYDPTKGTWTALGHPKGWNWIGDSPSTILPDGTYVVGDKLTEQDAALNPKTLKWTILGDKGKADFDSEEGWTLLPNGLILTADVKNAPNSELYNATAGKWTSAGSTIVDLHSPTNVQGCLTYGPKPKDCYYPPGEIGPAILRPDGTVFATGSGSGGSGFGPGHTAIFTPSGSSGSWTVGPDFPNGDNAGDSWAALEPSGNVLAEGVSGELYEWNGSTFTQVGGAGGSLLPLPSGQILVLGYGSMSLYTPTGKPKAQWAPTITTVPTTVARGKTYKISGTQFNGFSQAVAFGDEYQNATNYPLVRITNSGTGHVFYTRTHDHSTMGVATGSLAVSTNFDVPKKMDTGKSTLVVVANGIASTPVNVTVK